MYGRTHMGIERTTFVIDENGRVAKAFPRVKVQGHAEEVLEAVRGA
jgi:peroxiredoxin Q/BCP